MHLELLNVLATCVPVEEEGVVSGGLSDVQDVCWLHFNSRLLHLVLGKHALLLHKASLLTASRPAGSDVGN